MTLSNHNMDNNRFAEVEVWLSRSWEKVTCRSLEDLILKNHLRINRRKNSVTRKTTGLALVTPTYNLTSSKLHRPKFFFFLNMTWWGTETSFCVSVCQSVPLADWLARGWLIWYTKVFQMWPSLLRSWAIFLSLVWYPLIHFFRFLWRKTTGPKLEIQQAGNCIGPEF